MVDANEPATAAVDDTEWQIFNGSPRCPEHTFTVNR